MTSPNRSGRRLAAHLVLVALAAAMAGGCLSTGAVQRAREAEQRDDYDRAVVEYTAELRKNPSNRAVRQLLDRAKLRASQDHFFRGRRLGAAGKVEDAIVEYQIAVELNPTHAEANEELQALRSKARAKLAARREGQTDLEALIDQTRNLAPLGLDLPTDIKLPDSLVFRDAGSRDVFTTLARLTDISIAFDPAFRDAPVTIEFRRKTFDEALSTLAASTRNFVRVTAQRTVTVIPDTPAKRREYEEEVVRTFYLSNADIKETVDLLRIVVDARKIAPTAATNAVTIKDTPERVAAAGRVIAAIDKARPEVVIDVEVLEVDRTQLREYGLQIASPGSPGINGAVDVNTEGQTLESVRNLTASGVFLTNLPALYYRLLKTDGRTRALANPHLRVSEGLSASAKFGERVPVPVTTFAPIATGGVNQQPITSFAYETIGVNIDVTPRTHHNDDVSLTLKVDVSSVSGTGFGGLPTFGSRAVNTVIRLKDGETNLLAGLIRDDERSTLDGVPGLSDLPLIGRFFAHNRRERVETDIVLTMTPHIIRVLDLTEADLRPFRVGRDTGSSVIDLPLPEPPRSVDPPPPIAIPAPTPPPPATGAPGIVPTPTPTPTPTRPPGPPPPFHRDR